METQQFYRPLLCEISWCLLPLRVTPARLVCSALHRGSMILFLLSSYFLVNSFCFVSEERHVRILIWDSIKFHLYRRHFDVLDQIHVANIFYFLFFVYVDESD